MGGIKNKLNKLSSNKVKNLFSSLSLAERADERSSSGEVKTNKTNNKSKSSGFCHLIQQTSSATFPVKGKELNLGSPARGAAERSEAEGLTNTNPQSALTGCQLPLRKGAQNLLWDQRRQMKSNRISIGGFDRVSKLAKYIGIACLSLAILSTLILNIVSSYSSSNIESNAEPLSEVSTLADDSICDPSNTNAPSCISMSISSHSATGDTNDGNLSFSIPQGGGLVAGRHTVKVVTNNVSGATLDLYAANSTNLTHTDNQGSTIPSVTISDNYYVTAQPLQDDNWGVAMPDSNYANQMNRYDSAEVYERYVANPGPIVDNGDVSITPKFAGVISADQAGQTDMAIEELSQASVSMQNIYYGVRVDHPEQLLAGNYQAEVVYTATTNEVEKPTIANIDPSQYELGSGASSQIAITGNNLASTYRVLVDIDNDDSYDTNEECTNLNVISDSQLTCNVPTDAPIGTYSLYTTTQGGTGFLDNTFVYAESLPDGMDRVSDDYGDDGHVAVDYDENMIPVVYDEVAKTWRVVTNAELQNPKNWYDYTEKQWANALTVSKSSLQSFRDKQTGVNSDTAIQVDNNTDILGWWVYIPRYSYKVLRKEMGDHYAEEQNYEIIFETNKDVTKEPATCSSSNANQYYQDCIKNQYGEAGIAYPGNNEGLKDKTAWATHPAFTWEYAQETNGLTRTVERNGFWVGKFETTGTQTNPTVKPNQQSNMGGSQQDVGVYYSMAKNIGVQDNYNAGEGFYEWYPSSRPSSNSHNLQSTTSHMIKNDEWGAVAYLSASKYGAGVGNVKSNTFHRYYSWQGSKNYDADGNDSAGGGVTGCGPYDISGSNATYYDGTQLNTSRIESVTACSESVPDRAWMGAIGRKASTTNSIYGVYDMAGGSSDRIAGLITNTNHEIRENTEYHFETNPSEPYINGYSMADGFDGYDGADARNCTWSTCGGHALYEIHNQQYVYDPYDYRDQAWGGSMTYFPGSNSQIFFGRGGTSNDYEEAGIFSYVGYGFETSYVGGNATRIVLLPAEDE